MHIPHTPFRASVALILSFILSGCGTTFNGVTLSEDQLKRTKRIVVIALAGDTVTYQRQGFVKGEFRAMDVPSWELDSLYANRFANEMTASLGVQAVAYRGSKHDTLTRSIYATNPVLRRDRFDWNAAKQDLRAIAVEADADLIALVLREGFHDELATTQFLVAGFGFSGGRGSCAAFANLTVMIVDSSRIEPIAGANVFKRGADGKILSRRRSLPLEMCENEARDLSPEQAEVLRRTLLTIVDPSTIQQTTKRLLKYE